MSLELLAFIGIWMVVGLVYFPMMVYLCVGMCRKAYYQVEKDFMKDLKYQFMKFPKTTNEEEN